MKITMYELLGLIKDGKAPKKIKYNGDIYYSSENRTDLHTYQTMDSNTTRKLSLITDNEYLDLKDYVEIIDKPKTIEKILISMDDNSMPFVRNSQHKRLSCSETDLMMATKINELIDEINNLKENKYE